MLHGQLHHVSNLKIYSFPHILSPRGPKSAKKWVQDQFLKKGLEIGQKNLADLPYFRIMPNYPMQCYKNEKVYT